jgi:5-methylcytosine-specific restriction endonuclease McrA
MRTSTIIKSTVKKKIPKAIRQQVWLKYNGKIYENKCTIIWCQNIISVFNFHVGHNVPESKGGGIEIENLRPICPNCNLSMGSMYSIDEWNKICEKKESFCTRIMKYFLKN